MKQKYLIGMRDIDWSQNRWVNKGYGFLAGIMPNCEYPTRKGFIPLYDRNNRKFYWFKIIKQSATHYGYIVERYPNFGKYWKDIIKPIN